MNRLPRCFLSLGPRMSQCPKNLFQKNLPHLTQIAQFSVAPFRYNTITPFPSIHSSCAHKNCSCRFHSRSLFSETKEQSKEETEKTETKAEEKDEETEEKEEEPKERDLEAELKAAIQEKETAAKEAKDRLLLTLADMENLRARSKREVENAAKYSAGEMAKGLLEVNDTLALALNAAKDDAMDGTNEKLKVFYEGVQMTETIMLKCFNKFGIEKMEVTGVKFNPHVHNCLYEYEDPNSRPGTVGQILKDGFMIKDKVLRAAQVGVVKGKYVPTEEELKAEDTKEKKK